MNGIGKIMALDRRKLRLVRSQIALEAEARSIDPGERLAFWKLHFTPLRQKILELDAHKKQVVKALASQK